MNKGDIEVKKIFTAEEYGKICFPSPYKESITVKHLMKMITDGHLIYTSNKKMEKECKYVVQLFYHLPLPTIYTFRGLDGKLYVVSNPQMPMELWAYYHGLECHIPRQESIYDISYQNQEMQIKNSIDQNRIEMVEIRIPRTGIKKDMWDEIYQKLRTFFSIL